MRLRRILNRAGLLFGLLGLNFCAVSPGGTTPAPRPSSSQAGPPTAPFLRIETGMHTAPISRIAVDAAERYLVTASLDKTARVWELTTGKLLQILRPPLGDGNEGKLYAVAISPDGATVAVGGWTRFKWEKSHSIYLFDQDSGRLIRRLTGLPDVILDLTYSPDGRYLAAALFGTNGIRLYRTADFREVARDEAYGGGSYGIDFDRQGRLVTSSEDGFIRLYDAGFRLLAKQLAPGRKDPFSVRFSPEGDRVAVGFDDSTAVNVLSGQDLSLLYAPDTSGMDNGNLMTVAWSQDGRTLYAGGRYHEGWIRPILQWSDAGRGPYRKWPASTDTIMDLRPLQQGRLVFGAADPAFGIFDAAGRKVLERLPAIVDYHNTEIRISPDGGSIEFGFKVPNAQGDWNRRLARWDFGSRQLVVTDPGTAVSTGAKLSPPRTTAPGLDITGWKNATGPRLNGQALPLQPYEESRSLAIAPDASQFLLGADWSLRLFDRQGRQQWEKPVPSVTWAVNISGDGRLAVAAFADGTLRWYRLQDGRELLTLFLHPDGQRWVAWTPEGFFDTGGGQELISYHLNQGADQAGEFITVDQLSAQFYRPDLVAGRLQSGGEQAIADAVARIGDIRQVLTSRNLPPEIELLMPAEVRQDHTDFALKFRIKDKGGGIGRVVYRIDGAVQEGRPGGTGITGREPMLTRVELPSGKRSRVEVSVFDASGKIESRSAAVVVRVDAPEVRSSLYVLSVGVDNYRNKEFNLKYATADARDVAEELRQRGQGLFQAVYVEPALLNEAVTLENIARTFDRLAERVGVDDVFVLFLAGHGLGVDGEYYFFPYDLVYRNNSELRDRGLSSDRLRQLLARIRAQKAVVMLDTCDSGTFVSASRAPTATRAAIDRLMRSTGRVILAGAGNQQMAQEGYQGHGHFSYAVITGLDGKADLDRDKTILISELATFLDNEVPRITDGRQYPMSDYRGMAFPIGLAP
jgi:WD40 repeat protein